MSTLGDSAALLFCWVLFRNIATERQGREVNSSCQKIFQSGLIAQGEGASWSSLEGFLITSSPVYLLLHLRYYSFLYSCYNHFIVITFRCSFFTCEDNQHQYLTSVGLQLGSSSSKYKSGWDCSVMHHILVSYSCFTGLPLPFWKTVWQYTLMLWGTVTGNNTPGWTSRKKSYLACVVFKLVWGCSWHSSIGQKTVFDAESQVWKWRDHPR